jgi:hypothetical protein
VRRALIALWPGTTVGGYRTGPDAQDHGLGKALDAMTTDQMKGDAIASWAIKLNTVHPNLITYVIYRQRIWNVSQGDTAWRPMADRGSPTQNHMDHVHISVV